MTAIRYRAVLFDLDGTLVDSQEAIVAAVRHALAVIGAGRLPDPDDIVAVIGRPLEQVLRDLGHHVPDQAAQLFAREFREHYARHFRSARLYPGVIETLRVLRELEARTALVTTKQQEQAEAVARETGLDGLLDHIHGWRPGRKHKPDPEPCLTALAALGFVPEEALMVGDTEQDIQSARAAGVATCAVSYGYRPGVLLRHYRPDYLIGDIRNLPSIILPRSAEADP